MKNTQELTAQEWCFLTLAGGKTLSKGEKITLKKDVAKRTMLELGSKINEGKSVKKGAVKSNKITLSFIDSNVDMTPENRINIVSHGLKNGDKVKVSTTGKLPAGLYISKSYFVINKHSDDFQLSLKKDGDPVGITAAKDGGNHSISKS